MPSGRIAFEHEPLYDCSAVCEYGQSAAAEMFTIVSCVLYSSADILRVPLGKPTRLRSSLRSIEEFDADAEDTGIWRGPVEVCSVEVSVPLSAIVLLDCEEVPCAPVVEFERVVVIPRVVFWSVEACPLPLDNEKYAMSAPAKM